MTAEQTTHIHPGAPGAQRQPMTGSKAAAPKSHRDRSVQLSLVPDFHDAAAAEATSPTNPTGESSEASQAVQRTAPNDPTRSSAAVTSASGGPPSGNCVEPAGAAFGAPRPRRRRPDPLTGCVNVLPDSAGRLGSLSYRVPEGLVVRAGDAVRVPFGRREVHGMVVGPGDASKATRDILEVFGVRSDPSDLSLAHTVARYHFVEPQAVLSRLSPTSGRGADPLPAEPVRVVDAVSAMRVPREVSASRRTLLVRAPGVDAALLAAHQAADLASTGGQVLVLCPTATLVTKVVKAFSSGAARLDSRAPRGAWKGFCEGTVPVGVGTRTAALYAADHLAGIVVVDEEHPGHLEVKQPATHARDLASARSRALRVPLRLISLTPTPQAFGVATDVFTVGLRSHWPKMVTIDRHDLAPGERLVPQRVKNALAAAEKAGQTPVVLAPSNQAVRRCVRCGAVRACTECDSSLCRHPEITACPECDSTDGVKMRGWDKDRLVDLFANRAKVVSLSELQAVTGAGTVVLFDLDALVNAPDLIPGRFAASVIATAASAAGPGGTVIGIGEQLRHPVIEGLFGAKDMAAVARRFHAAARAAGLPPFGRLVTIKVTRAHPPKVGGWPGQVHGPKKVAAKEWEILVRIGTDELISLSEHVQRLRRGGKCRVRVE